MDIKRREFLKIAGLSAIAGIGAPSALQLFNSEARASSSNPPAHGADPHAAPGAQTGKRYGMVIDVRKFKFNPGLADRCISACHSIHNVPNFGNLKDEIKWLWKEKYEHAFPDSSQYKVSAELEELPFLVLCNHCNNPPCVRACPTKATFKNAEGMVVMDYHRCIGCRFCMAACPYGARSFNWRDPRGTGPDGKPFIANPNPEFPTRMRGVVEKCTFCAERVEKGLQPACVEVCGNTKAMVFGDLNDATSEISRILAARFTIQRKPSLGTQPSVFYII